MGVSLNQHGMPSRGTWQALGAGPRKSHGF